MSAARAVTARWRERSARLPQEMRAALLARLVEEEDYGVIADRLACSEQVVR